MPNMPTRETITAQHPNHYSVQESVDCEKCNPFGLTEKQYRAILDQGGNPSEGDPPPPPPKSPPVGRTQRNAGSESQIVSEGENV